MEYSGIPASEGIAIAPVYILKQEEVRLDTLKISIENIDEQLATVDSSLATVITEIRELQDKARNSLGEEKAAVFEAHEILVSDPEYIDEIKNKIRNDLFSAANAVYTVTQNYLELFASIEDDYLREREADLRDVSKRFLNKILNISSTSLAEIAEKCILIAHDLSPSETAQINSELILGFAVETGGYTSHSSIIARTLQIPAIVGVTGLTENVKHGDLAVIDGCSGKIIINPDFPILESYKKLNSEFELDKKRLLTMISQPSVTPDGHTVEITANIGVPKDASIAYNGGAEGIGLFRTEFLYMNRNDFPSEEEQYESYKEVASAFPKPRPIIIRTLDIGGDKELPYLQMPKEMNPFLGYRAIRMSLDRKEIFKVQLRAILRASHETGIKIMFPMVSSLTEFREAKAILEEEKKSLLASNIPFNEGIETGIMIEIPAAAVMADKFAKEVDFFSIGTNDLIQYTMAADRMNGKISYLYQPLNPAVLRLINEVIKASHAHGKWTGMCGEMASNHTAIPILLGLGLDEFSMNYGAILKTRALIRNLNYDKMQKLTSKILDMDTQEEVIRFIAKEVPELKLKT